MANRKIQEKRRLYERERTLGAIDKLLRAGEGSNALYVVGDAGFGKSSLLEYALARARNYSKISLSVTETHESTPFGVADDLLGTLNISSSPEAQSQTKQERTNQLSQALQEWSSPPLIIAIDDMHWSDADSMNVIGSVLAQISTRQVVFLFTMRPWPPPALTWARLNESNSCGQIEELESLTFDSSSILLADILGNDSSQELRKWMWGLCAGNPLLLRQLATSWSQESKNTFSTEIPLRSHPNSIFGNLKNYQTDPTFSPVNVLLPKFAGIGQNALSFIKAASVLGTIFRPSVAGALAELDPDTTGQAIATLAKEGIIEPAGPGKTQFVHSLYRQALYDDIDIPIREELHIAAYKILESQNAPLGEIAFHAHSGGRKAEGSSIALLQLCAKRSLVYGAVSTATALYEQAVEICGDKPIPAQLLLDLAFSLVSVGRIEEAKALALKIIARPTQTDLESGLTHPTKAELTGAQSLLSKCNAISKLGLPHGSLPPDAFLNNSISSEVETSEEKDQGLGLEATRVTLSDHRSDYLDEVDPHLRATLLLDDALANWLSSGTSVALEQIRRARNAIDTLSVDDMWLKSSCMCAEGIVKVISANSSGYDLITSSVNLVKTDPQFRYKAASSTWNPAWAYIGASNILENFDNALAMYEFIKPSPLSQINIFSHVFYSVGHADTLWRIGRLQDAQEILVDALAISDTIDGSGLHVFALLAFIYQQLGNSTEALKLIERAKLQLDQGVGGTSDVHLWINFIECQESFSQGSIQDAANKAELNLRLSKQVGPIEPCVVPWQRLGIEVFIAAGMLDSANEIISDLEATISDLPCLGPRVAIEAGKGLIAWQNSQTNESRKCFQNALDLLEDLQMPLLKAETLYTYGKILRHIGQLQESRKLLHDAAAILKPAGAIRLVDFINEELSSAGARRRRNLELEDKLTRRELQVAQLAANGASNNDIAARLFISPKTVDHHLSRCYRKLNIASRWDLQYIDLESASRG